MDKFNLDVSLVARVGGHSALRTYRDPHLCFDSELCFGETREIKVLCSGRSMVASLKCEATDGRPPPGVRFAASTEEPEPDRTVQSSEAKVPHWGETERGFTVWAATSYTMLAAEVVPALVTDRLTEPRVDVDAWGHPGLPHMRLDFTVVDAEALHYSSAMRKAQDTAPAAAQAEKSKENKGGVGVTA